VLPLEFKAVFMRKLLDSDRRLSWLCLKQEMRRFNLYDLVDGTCLEITADAPGKTTLSFDARR
jgi:hypothetical protein